MESTRGHILIISYSFRPFVDPRAFRWTSIAEEFVRRGYSVSVVAAWRPGTVREEYANGIHVYRTGGRFVERLRPLLGGSRVMAPNSIDILPKPESRRTLMRKIHDATWKQLHWPDFASLWRVSARRKVAAILKSTPADAVFTVAVPFTSHLVFQSLRDKFPHVRWIADNGDPFSFAEDPAPNNLRLYRLRNASAEHEVGRKADAFTVTTESTRREYARLFPDIAEKLLVIGPMLSAPKTTHTASTVFPADDVIRLLYVGTLYRHLRNPRFLLQLFSAVRVRLKNKRVELHVMGAVRDCADLLQDFKSHLGSALALHGLVDRMVVSQAINSAAVLVNIGNDNSTQLPSKVVDYVSTGRPIINIATRPDDSSHEFFVGYPAYLNFVDNGGEPTQSDVGLLADFLQHLPPRVDDQVCRSKLAPYGAEAIVTAYERLAFPGSKSAMVATEKAERPR